MKICWVNPLMETDPTSAGRIQTLSLVRGLAERGHTICLIAYGPPIDLVRGNLHLQFMKTDFTRNYFLRGIRFQRRALGDFLGIYYYFDASLPYPGIQSEVENVLSQGGFDLVNVDHFFLGRHLGRIVKNFGLPLMLTTHNVESILAEQTLKEASVSEWLIKKALNKVRRAEMESISSADHVICVSQRDCDALSQGADRSRFSIIPLGVHLQQEKPLPEGNNLLFVGSNFEPNRFALRHIVEEIAPKVPEGCFNIVGGVCETAGHLDVPDNVILVGKVSLDDLYRIYGEASIALAPLTVGSGLNMKILEYLAWGIPTIATKIAVQALPELEDGVDVAVEDRITEFPRRIRLLLGDKNLRKALHENSRRKVEKKYSFDRVLDQYETLFKSYSRD